MSEVTRILSAIEKGDPRAAEHLLPLVYDELRKLAAHRLAQEKPGQTLQATALVHEAYLRLVDVEKASRWASRGHFFAAAAEAMRRILVDRARAEVATSGAAGSRNSTSTPSISSAGSSRSSSYCSMRHSRAWRQPTRPPAGWSNFDTSPACRSRTLGPQSASRRQLLTACGTTPASGCTASFASRPRLSAGCGCQDF